MSPEFSGAPRGQGRRCAVVVSRFNETITQRLLEGALDAFVRHGVGFDDVDVFWVPGAWELPAAARRVAASERYDALVALGAVIRGETPPFAYVAGGGARGLRLRTRAGPPRSPHSRWPISSIRSMARRRTETRARVRAIQALYAWD